MAMVTLPQVPQVLGIWRERPALLPSDYVQICQNTFLSKIHEVAWVCFCSIAEGPTQIVGHGGPINEWGAPRTLLVFMSSNRRISGWLVVPSACGHMAQIALQGGPPAATSWVMTELQPHLVVSHP